MKRTFLITLTIATLASCSNEEIVNTPNKEAITFADVFVDKATRAIDGSYTTASLKQFQAYGTITNDASQGTANIFDGEVVTKGGTGTGAIWTYDATNTQYWIPGNTYRFSAVVDGNIKGVTTVNQGAYGMPSAITLLDASAQTDILYAENGPIQSKVGDGAKTVTFIFSHLMAKAKFTVKNTITTNNGYSYKVSDITINGTERNAVYTIGTGWQAAETTATYDLSFGDAVTEGTTEEIDATSIAHGSKAESNYERLLIPGEKALTVSFNYQLLKDDAVIDTQSKQLNTATITLEAGKAYNFVISLGNPGEPITFDVKEVKGWTPAGDANGETNVN